MKVRGQGRVMEAIGFGMGKILEELQGFSGRIDLAFCPSMNTYQGNQNLQLRIKDLVLLPQ
jgi:RecJ OB domain